MIALHYDGAECRHFHLGCALLPDVSSLLNSWTQQSPKVRIQSLLNSSIHWSNPIQMDRCLRVYKVGICELHLIILLKMYSFTCSYVLRTFLLFPLLRLKKEMEKQKLFVHDKIKAIHKTKTTASIIKHSIIHINMYLEKGMNVVFHHYPNAIFFISSSFCAFLLCIACILFLFFIQRLVSTEVY